MQKNTFSQPLWKIITFSLPICATGMIGVLSGFIAMMMAAYLGEEQLAAGALGMYSSIMLMTMSATLFYAVGILISHAKGKNESHSEIGKFFANGIWISIFVTIPIGLIVWNFDKLLLLFGQDPHLAKLARGYFHFASLSLFFYLANTVVSQFYSGIGIPRFSFITGLISLPLSVFFSYGFIFGRFGLPTLGLGGITCTTLVVQAFLLIGAALFMYFRGTFHRYQLLEHLFWPNLNVCKSIFTLGFPISMQFGGELAAMTIVTYMLGHFGAIPLAAAQVVTQYTLLFVMIIIGITQAVSLLVSQAYGSKDHSLIYKYIQSSILFFSTFMIVIVILFLGFSSFLVKFYFVFHVVDPNLNYFAIAFFTINCVFLLFDGLRNIFSGALRGLHDSIAPMRIGIITLWFISLPIAYFIGFTLRYGPIGLRIGFTAGIIFSAIWIGMRLRMKLHLLAR